MDMEVIKNTKFQLNISKFMPLGQAKMQNMGCEYHNNCDSCLLQTEFIDDIKQLLHVVVLYIPLPIFWALFDQQGSRWTLQATKMDGRLVSFNILISILLSLNLFLNYRTSIKYDRKY